jgi:hypothetical protein
MKKFLAGATSVAAFSLIAASVTGALAFGMTPAGASNKEISSVGSNSTYVLMHALFPTSINNLLPGGTTAHQKVAATATSCTGGLNFTTHTAFPKGAPNGSGAGKTYAHTEEGFAASKKGCVTIVRSSSPPEGSGGSATASPNFDYYAYALDGVAPFTGIHANKSTESTTNPVVFTLAELRSIYHCTVGFTNWATLGGTSGTINRFWPQTGSGTRSVYKDILGFTPVTTKGSCSTAAITQFTTVTVTGTKKNEVNEESTESGMIYATKLLHVTIANDVFIYSAGRFVAEWGNTTEYGTTKHNRINGQTIGNFTPTKLEIAATHQRTAAGTTTASGAVETYVTFTATTSKRTHKKAAINTATVSEGNEWYSNLAANTSSPKTSKTRVVGIRYVYNVCDTALPGYNACKLLVGFDNQNVTQTATQTSGAGTKSRLCAGDDSTVIVAQGFVPLAKSAGPSATDNLATATCREFPGSNYPGKAPSTKIQKYVFNTWVNPTGSTGVSKAAYTEQAGYPAINNTGTTLPVTTAAVGDVMLVMAHTAPSSGTSDVSSITDSNSRITWQAAKSTGFTNHPSGDAIEIWYGVVKSVGPTTIDVHWSGTTFDHFVWADEWKSVLGANVSWSVVSSGIKNSSVGTGTTCAYPTLTSGSAGGLYWGWAYGSAVGSAGATPGFSYHVTTDPTHENVLVSDPSLADSTAYTPTFSQAKATSWYDAASVIVEAVAASP